MKHVTLFSQLAEYQTFMGVGDGLKPNVSYVREDSKVYSTGAASEDFSGAVVYARYNITEDMSKNGLFSTSNVKTLKVDGEVIGTFEDDGSIIKNERPGKYPNEGNLVIRAKWVGISVG